MGQVLVSRIGQADKIEGQKQPWRRSATVSRKELAEVCLAVRFKQAVA